MMTLLIIFLAMWGCFGFAWFFENFDKHERFGRDIPTWPKKLLYAVSIFFIGGPGVWVVSVVGVILSLIFIPIIMGISWLYEKFQEKLVGKLKAWFLK